MVLKIMLGIYLEENQAHHRNGALDLLRQLAHGLIVIWDG